MRRIITLLVILFCPTFSFAQEGNLWRPFFERAITFNENNEYEEAEEQFREAQQLLLEEFGLNEATHATYCHILYRRAHNLFLLDGMQDSSYVCFKELYDLSKTPVDTVSGNWFRVESAIMLSTIDLDRGNIRDCCELLESEKQMIDRLDSKTRLGHKYYFYKNLAKTYNQILVNHFPNSSQKFQPISSQYLIVRDGAFYKDYISVYEELVNLSQHFNKGEKSIFTEDLTALAEHYLIPEDDYLALKTFERAFSLWNKTKDHNDIDYLRLCKGYLTYRNRSVLHLDYNVEQKIVREFDSIITKEDVYNDFSYIELMDLYSVRLQDKSLDESKKEVFVNRICEDFSNTDNYIILIYICGYTTTNKTLESINNIKVLIEYLSLCSNYYYEKEENFKADMLLNKARFFSFLLPDGDRLFLEEHNNAIAKSAEVIGDFDNYYGYKAVNFTCKVARGIIPTQDEWLLVCNHFDTEERISKLLEGINIFGRDKYDKDLIEFYLSLIDVYFENGEMLKVDENIAIADSITKIMIKDGHEISQKVMSDLFYYKALSAFHKGDIFNAKVFANKSFLNGGANSITLLIELTTDRIELDSIVSIQFRNTKSFIEDSYPFLSERERVTFSQGKQFQWLSSIPRYADKYVDDTLLLSMAYNSALISKGTSISVSTDIINKAREVNEEALDEFIQQYSISASDTNEITLNNRHFYLEFLEKEMQRFSGVSPQYLSTYFGVWEEISARLSENEIAIEFIEYVPLDEGNADNLYLGALYLLKNGHPRIIRICKVAEIDTLKTQEGQSGLDGIYDLVWQPILKESQDINRIWFSPSVHLFQTNIESALPESIDAYRVSSTRNLLTLNDAPDFSEVALFGGLNYDEKATQTEDGIADNTAYNIMRGSNIGEERVGLTFLKGSLREVTTAQTFLSPVNDNIRLFVDKNGTEECFKSLSGEGVSLLHIATHGFYIKNNDAVANVGNRIMRRSGLFMSGAKAIWKGSNEKYSGDDGILLSEEIVSLDFSKLNLVVLSACGTGLGNPTNDGVYGLQRAFKKAGAQTIIMSLWNVDDNATALMMETFYQELIRTNSKHQAFKKAQKTVREAFEDPYYWSAFIMLD